jgi:hypothetical protein
MSKKTAAKQARRSQFIFSYLAKKEELKYEHKHTITATRFKLPLDTKP